MGASPASATTFGKYSLVAKLAIGGMAEIFLARLQGAAGFEKLVCIKRILPSLAKDQQFVTMLLGEARIAAQISHGNVCQVFELGEIAGQYFIAMEYLEGVPLACFRRPDLYPEQTDPRLVAGILIQACEGLHSAHQLQGADGSLLGVVHRDVSGNNVFVTVGGIVKVLDFGIAKAQDASVRTTTGSIKGTYAYMSPEQLKGERVDRRTDVFAAGILTWELFARKHLFKRDTDFLTFQAITTEPIPNICELRPDLPPALGDAVAKALSRDRDARFPTARALGEAIAAAVATLGGPLAPSAISEEVERAFARSLIDQRKLARLAREGGTRDLDLDPVPAIGHGTELLTTPLSAVSGVDRAAATSMLPPAQPELPAGPRSATVSVPPLPPIPTTSARRQRRWMIALGLIALAAIGAAIFFATSREQTGPVAERSAATNISMPADARSTALATALDAAVVSATVAIDALPSIPPSDAALQSEPAKPSEPDKPDKPDKPDNRTKPVNVGKSRAPAQVDTGPPGFITIDSTPVYANITVDGKPYGETPLIRIALAPGRHTVKAKSADGATKTFIVKIESGVVAPTKRLEW